MHLIFYRLYTDITNRLVAFLKLNLAQPIVKRKVLFFVISVFRIVQGNVYNMRLYMVRSIKLELPGVGSRHVCCKIMPRRFWMINLIWNHWFDLFHFQMWKACPLPRRLFHLWIKFSNYCKHTWSQSESQCIPRTKLSEAGKRKAVWLHCCLFCKHLHEW